MLKFSLVMSAIVLLANCCKNAEQRLRQECDDCGQEFVQAVKEEVVVPEELYEENQ
ncbi:MAG: hypothetical protein ACTHMC_16830 [Pseudobacter sp.]|uniref:hypothetical protein n=1 Tax=Pseudobacter sp. TaxID=2045420 RepID=UPI003F7D2E6B